MRVMDKRDEPERRLEIFVVGLAILLLGCALAADQAWFDRHFLPVFIVPRPVMMIMEQGLRGTVILAAFGGGMTVAGQGGDLSGVPLPAAPYAAPGA